MIELRAALEAIEDALAGGALADARPGLAVVAVEAVTVGDEELRAARRRAMLLLAAGGDPLRGLDLEGPAVTALARDLETPARMRALQEELAAVRAAAAGLPRCTHALDQLAADPQLAWRAFACALLAEELAED